MNGRRSVRGDLARQCQPQSSQRRREDVTPHVAERAGAVAHALPPVAGVIDRRLERPRLAHADPAIPVEPPGHRVGARRNGIRVAPGFVAEGVDLADPADRAIADQLLGDELRLVRRDLDPHLRDEIRLTGLEREDPGFANRQGERLLDVDGFAHRHGSHRDRRVHVVRRRDVDRIDVVLFLAEHLPPVLVDAGFWKQLRDLRGPGLVDVGNRRQRERGVGRECPEIRERLAGRPHARMTNLSLLPERDGSGERTNHRCARNTLQEPAARD
jgi:hypothetical protein